MGDNSYTSLRLPKNVFPNSYKIEMKPNIRDCVFSGVLQVDLTVKIETDKIIMNALHLEIFDVSFKNSGDEEFVCKEVILSNASETATLLFSNSIGCGDGTLSLKFNGNLNRQMNGFYLTKNEDPNDSTHEYAAVTHFEATYARKAFPCWDEPEFKAVFNITLVAENRYVTLSNTNVIKETKLDSNLRAVEFASTPVMSTYLVAFVVGRYDFVEKISEDGLIMRVYTPKTKAEQGNFALEVLSKVIPFYESYFNFKYPLPKIDLIAINEFAIGAMENWGLVTYRENCLLLDKNICSNRLKQRIATLIGHEIAHQWFGNLVTMKWWTDLWLKEGFANFMECFSIQHIFPDFDIWSDFLTNTYCIAQSLDALNNSHPIEVAVNNPAEVNEIFDAISYDKGASIIRMLHNFLGNDSFRDGLQLYLERFMYKNTTTADLWNCLSEKSDSPVANIMNTWTTQKGYPVLIVNAKHQGDKLVLNIEQKKFSLSNENEEDSLWMVPISIVSQANSDKVLKQMILSAKETNIDMEYVTGDQWIKINPNSIDFYRVRYSKELFAKFVPSIRSLSLPFADRLNLHNDYFYFVLNGTASMIQFLELTENYTNEMEFSVWSSIQNSLRWLSISLDDTEAVHNLKAYGKSLFKNILDKLGWHGNENESHLTVLLRSLVLDSMVSFNHDVTLKEAKERFDLMIKGTDSLSPNISSIVYKGASMEGDKETLAIMTKMLEESNSQEIKNQICSVLGTFTDPILLKEILQYSLSDKVSLVESAIIIRSFTQNSKSRIMVWNFFKENINKFIQRYNAGMLLSNLIKNLVENFRTDEMYNDMKKFFEEVKYPGTESALKCALENILVRKCWFERQGMETVQWLLQKNYKE